MTKPFYFVDLNAQEDRMGMTTVLNVSGIDKEKFVKYTEDKPATYQDWSRTWKQVLKIKFNVF
jgi:hypothetical protein